ncbi:hypothetical protein PROFUN_11101 [Planoprotostelium fungivorum]|uniref:Homeobox domain-containing protein n=1 Tax=Planoprotostelium fungivorum TaxID=1890364 RepID=A0A2P6NAL1_9EUKA|nr:hypothetical protein PROFUN_11101 [Planoprotostelium fungivorum]
MAGGQEKRCQLIELITTQQSIEGSDAGFIDQIIPLVREAEELKIVQWLTYARLSNWEALRKTLYEPSAPSHKQIVHSNVEGSADDLRSMVEMREEFSAGGAPADDEPTSPEQVASSPHHVTMDDAILNRPIRMTTPSGIHTNNYPNSIRITVDDESASGSDEYSESDDEETQEGKAHKRRRTSGGEEVNVDLLEKLIEEWLIESNNAKRMKRELREKIKRETGGSTEMISMTANRLRDKLGMPRNLTKRKDLGDGDDGILIRAFSQNPMPDKAQKEELAKRSGFSAKQVNVWFSNRRQRGLNKRERDYLLEAEARRKQEMEEGMKEEKASCDASSNTRED